MQRIWSQPKEHVELATKVLVCVTHAARPLRLKEVQYAIAVGEETQVLDPEYDLDDPDDMLTSCAGLVRVDAESMTMRLAHYTTQTFLESLGDSLMSNPHDLLASSCLNYLHMDPFSEGHMDEYQEFPFLQYSAKFWDWHLSTGSGAAALKQQAMTFLDNIGRVQTVLEASRPKYSWGLFEHHGSCVLHLLARKGLDTWIDQYIAYRSTNMSIIDCSPSCAYCRDLYAENMKHFDPKTSGWEKVLTAWRDMDGYTPLSCAIEAGHSTTAEILLQLNPEVLNDETTDPSARPLYRALCKGNEKFALRILQHPDMISWKWSLFSRERYSQTYLHTAVSYQQWSVVAQILHLAAGLREPEAGRVREIFKAKTMDRQSLMHIAAEDCNKPEILEELLIYVGRNELNAQDSSGSTPLHVAVECGSLEAVQFFTGQANIQTDLRDGKGLAALDHAARVGDDALKLRYLLGTNLFSADSTDSKGRSALFSAVERSDAQAVLLLASREDVDVDRADCDGVTALMLAGYNMLEDILAHLAPLAQKIDLADASGNTALHHLVNWVPLFHGGDTTFKNCLGHLLKAGASLEKPNSDNETAYEVLCRRIQEAEAAAAASETESVEEREESIPDKAESVEEKEESFREGEASGREGRQSVQEGVEYFRGPAFDWESGVGRDFDDTFVSLETWDLAELKAAKAIMESCMSEST